MALVNYWLSGGSAVYPSPATPTIQDSGIGSTGTWRTTEDYNGLTYIRVRIGSYTSTPLSLASTFTKSKVDLLFTPTAQNAGSIVYVELGHDTTWTTILSYTFQPSILSTASRFTFFYTLHVDTWWDEEEYPHDWINANFYWGTGHSDASGDFRFDANVASVDVNYVATGQTTGTAPPAQTGALFYNARYNTGNLAKTGYAFAGWNTLANGSGTTYLENARIPISGNLTTSLTLYSKWTPLQFTATWDAQGGTPATQTNTATYNANLMFPTTPTRAHYTFGGWWTGINGTGTQITGPPVFTGLADVTYYAKWTQSYPSGNITLSGSYSASEFNGRINAPYVTSVALTGNVSVTGVVEFNNYIDFSGNYIIQATGFVLKKWKTITIHTIEAITPSGAFYDAGIQNSTGSWGTPGIIIPSSANFSALYPKPSINGTRFIGFFCFGDVWKPLGEIEIKDYPQINELVFDNCKFYGPIEGTCDGVKIKNFEHYFMPISSDGLSTRFNIMDRERIGVSNNYKSLCPPHAFYIAGSNNTIEDGILDHRCAHVSNGTVVLGAAWHDGDNKYIDRCRGGLKIQSGNSTVSNSNILRRLNIIYGSAEECFGTEFYGSFMITPSSVVSRIGNTVRIIYETGNLSWRPNASMVLTTASGLAQQSYYKVLSWAEVSSEEWENGDGYTVVCDLVLDSSQFSVEGIAQGDTIKLNYCAIENVFEDITITGGCQEISGAYWKVPAALNLFFNTHGSIVKNITVNNVAPVKGYGAITNSGHCTPDGPSGQIFNFNVRNSFENIFSHGYDSVIASHVVIGDDGYWVPEENFDTTPTGGGDVLIAPITSDDNAKITMLNVRNISVFGIPVEDIETRFLYFDPSPDPSYPWASIDNPGGDGWILGALPSYWYSIWNAYQNGDNPYIGSRLKAPTIQQEPDSLILTQIYEYGGQSATTFASLNYLVTLNTQGGTGQGNIAFSGTPIVLPIPFKFGYSFVEWNTAIDGMGDSYDYSTAYSFTSDLALYAIYEPANQANTIFLFEF